VCVFAGTINKEGFKIEIFIMAPCYTSVKAKLYRLFMLLHSESRNTMSNSFTSSEGASDRRMEKITKRGTS
jgi:hypothetical protein